MSDYQQNSRKRKEPSPDSITSTEQSMPKRSTTRDPLHMVWTSLESFIARMEFLEQRIDNPPHEEDAHSPHHHDDPRSLPDDHHPCSSSPDIPASEDGKQTYYQFIEHLHSSKTVDEMGLYLGAVKSLVELRFKRRKPDPSHDEHVLDFDHIMRGLIPEYISETLENISWSFWSVVFGQDGNEIFALILHLNGYNGKFEPYWKQRFESEDHEKAFSSLDTSNDSSSLQATQSSTIAEKVRRGLTLRKRIRVPITRHCGKLQGGNKGISFVQDREANAESAEDLYEDSGSDETLFG